MLANCYYGGNMKTYEEILNMLTKKTKNIKNTIKKLNSNKQDVEDVLCYEKFPNMILIKKICKYLNIFEDELHYAIHKEKEKEQYVMAERARQRYIQNMHIYERKKKGI